ncbi:fibrinogen-like protein 1 [Drosophila bipectinata]|uniref:fibrinogen-like protein 1 n=1 Tax=Drosophila bipectinata TaxID=42026 RepID=UPI0038B2536E
MVQPVVLLSAICFITVALGSEESCYFTEEKEDDCAAVCHPIVKPLLRYFEKIQAKESQFQKDYSELKKKYTDLEEKGQEHNGQISQFQKNYSDLQKKYSDLQESHSELQRRELELISQLQKDISDLQKDKSDLQNRVIEVENLQAQIDSKNVEIKLLKDKISELNKTNELATKILRDDIAKLGEIVKNINSDNGAASPSPTRTVQQLPPPSKAIPDRCPQSQNETWILQEIQIPGSDPFKVVCYSDEEIGSGWMIVYNHWGETNYFNRTYEEFERGFGDVGTHLTDKYFIGLERLHLLTSRNSHELKINPYKCDSFVVGNRSESYMVKANKGCTGRKLPNLRQVKFSTWDRDEDGDPDSNLAKIRSYGWWHEPRSGVHYTAFSMMIRRKD